MLTAAEADELAHHWIQAWNDHDLERILRHYADDVVFSSPFIQKIWTSPSGAIVGESLACLLHSRPRQVSHADFPSTRRFSRHRQRHTLVRERERFGGG